MGEVQGRYSGDVAASPLVELEGEARAVGLDAADEVALAPGRDIGRCGRDVGEMWAIYGRDVGEMWARCGGGATDEVGVAPVERVHLVTSISPAPPIYLPCISPISRLYLAPVERGDERVHLVTELERYTPVLRHLGN